MLRLFYILAFCGCLSGRAAESDRLNHYRNAEGDSCDLIVMRNGEELKARVLVISELEIRLKKCDFQTGPDYVLNRSDVAVIRYVNGSTEVFKVEHVPPPAGNKRSRRDSVYRDPLWWLNWLPRHGPSFPTMINPGF